MRSIVGVPIVAGQAGSVLSVTTISYTPQPMPHRRGLTPCSKSNGYIVMRCKKCMTIPHRAVLVVVVALVLNDS